MAYSAWPDQETDERIVDIDVSEEMRTSYLEYAYSVIYSRALPDARDGLKPVQRRILYSMDDAGVTPKKAHVKCSRVVGQVMGALHPHGDQAIYDALARMAQPWTMRLPLVDGHGNFGSLDAGPAAMRYTECRMSEAATAMTAGLDQDTVDFRPNYDGKQTEPSVLPAAFPNLLVNGAAGIAVGMATNMAPHNLSEVVSALIHLLSHPDADLDELMRFVPGPDFPTGGTIVGLDGVREAYETGRGAFKVRAKTRIEKVSPRRQGIVVTELPHGVGPEKIIEQIKAGVDAKRLTGIADVKDLTDLAHGTRLVIEVKNGINPEALLEQLRRSTKLQDSFAINAVALVEGQPRTLGLRELLRVYLDHRIEVTMRRTQFRLRKARERAHLVAGLLLAVLDIDQVIAIIRGSDDAAQAKARLIGAFELSDQQADHILDMQLRRLTKLSRIELEAEAESLAGTIAELSRIVSDESALKALVAKELTEVAERFASPRRTVLLASTGTSAATTPLEVPDAPCRVLLGATGLAARVDSAEPLSGSGSRSGHDAIVSSAVTTAHGVFAVVTDKGRLIRAQAIELPTVPATEAAISLRGGSRASELWGLADDERALFVASLASDGLGLALGTRNGVVKRVHAETMANKDSWDVIRLDDGDRLVGGAELADESDELVFITSDAQLLRFPAAAVRPQGRTGGGVAGVRLGADAEAIWFGVCRLADADVVTVSGSSRALPGAEHGNAKTTPLSEFPGKGRATGGVRCHRFLKGEDRLILAYAGPAPVVALAADGSPVTLAPPGRRDGSGTPPAAAVAALGTRGES